MKHKKSEKGQAIILIVFSIIGLIGLTGLTVDGGMAYTDRRHAQGAVDSAAWAAGLTNARFTLDANADGILEADPSAIESAALDIAEQNGYTNDGVDSIVEVIVADDTSGLCPVGAAPNVHITVKITSNVDTFFAPVIGVETVTNRVSAETRACGVYIAPIFGGSAIFNLGVGADANDCAFDSGNGGAEWIVKCSGVFSNTCAHSSSNNADALKLLDVNGNVDPSLCVSSVGGADGVAVEALACAAPASPTAYDLNYAIGMMPPNPCTGAVTNGVYAGGGLKLTVPNTNSLTLPSSRPSGEAIGDKDYVYCVEDADDLENVDVTLSYATLYFMEEDFDLKYAGNTGSISGTPTQSGVYSSYSVIVGLPADPTDTTNYCSATNDHSGPSIDYRGNGCGSLYGTFLAPSACVTMAGNAGSGQGQSCDLTIKGQLVTNMVYSNGTANVTVDYCEDTYRQEPADPNVSLIK